jgi:hypothetical protein
MARSRGWAGDVRSLLAYLVFRSGNAVRGQLATPSAAVRRAVHAEI